MVVWEIMGGVKLVKPIKRNIVSKGWGKRKIHFSFGELKRKREKRERRARAWRERESIKR